MNEIKAVAAGWHALRNEGRGKVAQVFCRAGPDESIVNEIKAVAMDVDGVLTDGSFWWGPGGAEFKQFHFADVMGISLGRKAGLVFALVSGEASPLVDRFAEKMGITDVYKGCKDKAGACVRSPKSTGSTSARYASWATTSTTCVPWK